jgi:hypothetical protein
MLILPEQFFRSGYHLVQLEAEIFSGVLSAVQMLQMFSCRSCVPAFRRIVPSERRCLLHRKARSDMWWKNPKYRDELL